MYHDNRHAPAAATSEVNYLRQENRRLNNELHEQRRRTEDEAREVKQPGPF